MSNPDPLRLLGEMQARNARLVAALTEVYELAAGCNEIRLDSPQMRRAREALAPSEPVESNPPSFDGTTYGDPEQSTEKP